jgi:hypothetical protein
VGKVEPHLEESFDGENDGNGHVDDVKSVEAGAGETAGIAGKVRAFEGHLNAVEEDDEEYEAVEIVGEHHGSALGFELAV